MDASNFDERKKYIMAKTREQIEAELEQIKKTCLEEAEEMKKGMDNKYSSITEAECLSFLNKDEVEAKHLIEKDFENVKNGGRLPMLDVSFDSELRKGYVEARKVFISGKRFTE